MTRCVSLASGLAVTGLILFCHECAPPLDAQTPLSATSSAKALDRVTASAVQRKTLTLRTSQPGRIQAYEETPIVPKVTGYVEEVLVDIGDRVAKDQTLVKLWIPEMDDELRQMEAMVALAEAELRQAEVNIQAAQAAAETARAKVQQAEASTLRTDSDLARWKSEYARMKELAENRSITNKLAEETLQQFRAAEAAQQETAASIALAKAAAAEALINIQQTEAARDTAQGRLRIATTNLARTTTLSRYAHIKAPFAGVITHRYVDTGHYVQPTSSGNSKPLLVVTRLDLVRVAVDVPELEAALVDSGDSGDAATVQVQALGGRVFESQVARTSWSLDATNRSLRAEIDIPNADGSLRPGMYAMTTIQLDERVNVVTLPVAAIVRDGDQTYCCAVEPGKIVRLPIQLGLRSGNDVEVLSGVDAGRIVVMARAESLQPGQPVEVLPTASK